MKNSFESAIGYVVRMFAMVMFVMAISVGTSLAQTPQIKSITGYTDGAGCVVAGRWSGQPANAPSKASNKYKGKLAVDSYDYGSSANPYYWEINGSNFGTDKGSISIGPNPTPFSSVTIQQWTATKVRILVVAPRSFITAGFTLTLNTAKTAKNPTVRSATFSDSAVVIIKSRGYGQCTYLVAKTRLDNRLAIPPTAYTITKAIPSVGSVDTGYRPAIFDCLNYSGNHVAIITTTPVQKTNSDGSLTWTFAVSEFNAYWDEALSTSSRTYMISKANSAGQRTVLGGIGTCGSKTWFASGYYR